MEFSAFGDEFIIQPAALENFLMRRWKRMTRFSFQPGEILLLCKHVFKEEHIIFIWLKFIYFSSSFFLYLFLLLQCFHF